MALGEGPLRTKELTKNVPGYAPRTIYRYAAKLAELDVVERDEEPGVPSRVDYRLTEPCGTDLFELIDCFATASMQRLPDGRISAHSWASLGLLADLWESGIVAELSCEARSPTQLARSQNGLSYHQVNRRANLFKLGGLLREAPTDGRRKCYQLTTAARRAIGLVGGIGRWRHDNVVPEGQKGLTLSELATVLRAVLPLVRMPDYAERTVRFGVHGGAELNCGKEETVWAQFRADGTLDSCAGSPGAADGWARGTARAWLEALLDDERGGLRMGADQELVDSYLAQLHAALWTSAQSRERVLQLD